MGSFPDTGKKALLFGSRSPVPLSEPRGTARLLLGVPGTGTGRAVLGQRGALVPHISPALRSSGGSALRAQGHRSAAAVAAGRAERSEGARTLRRRFFPPEGNNPVHLSTTWHLKLEV